MSKQFLDGKVTLHCGDCLDILKTLPDNSIDSCVTDPPYHLTDIQLPKGKYGERTEKEKAERRASRGFMGKQWDGGDIAFRPEVWREVYRVLKPGAHLLAFGGTRTYHRMACAIEDAGFQIRDQIQWLYGSGFPKSHDIAKHIDRQNGHWRGRAGTVVIEEQPSKGAEYERTEKGEPITAAARQWEGWGTALKPANEPICLARKPLSESTVAAHVLRWGVGAINVDGCRIQTSDDLNGGGYDPTGESRKDLSDATSYATRPIAREFVQPEGRWPANVIHDGSEEVVAGFPDSENGHWAGAAPGFQTGPRQRDLSLERYATDSGAAARFFYTAKADSDDRLGSKHPTVKPLDLMQYLVRLVTPKGGVVLDPFAGTGTTGEAAWREGMRAVLIEREAEYQDDIRRRMKLCMAGPDERAREAIKARTKDKPVDAGPLFGGANVAVGGQDDLRRIC